MQPIPLTQTNTKLKYWSSLLCVNKSLNLTLSKDTFHLEEFRSFLKIMFIFLQHSFLGSHIHREEREHSHKGILVSVQGNRPHWQIAVGAPFLATTHRGLEDLAKAGNKTLELGSLMT